METCTLTAFLWKKGWFMRLPAAPATATLVGQALLSQPSTPAASPPCVVRHILHGCYLQALSLRSMKNK